MVRSFLVFAATFAATIVGFAPQAHAFCTPGTVATCFLNGKQGTRTCGSNGMFGPCIVPSDPPPPSCIAQPKYKVLTVVYAPPGHSGGGSTSSVSYGSGSSLGTTCSSSNGFKQSYAVSATVKSGIFSDSSLSVSYSRNSVDAKSDDFKKTTAATLTQGGPSVDGIDHDRDEIWLWLGPKLTLKMPTTSTITWEPADNQVVDIQFVYVGDLKDPSHMPPGVATRLQSYGITTADFPAILQADPFAFGDIAIDPNRYEQLNTTFPYEPPFAPGDPSPTLNFTATRTLTHTITTTTTNEYSLGVTLSVLVGSPSVFQAALKSTNSWTWTDTNSRADAVGSTESASVTVGGPAFGYTGPTDVAVYYDLMYKTFLFKFVTTNMAVVDAPFEGVVVSESGTPVAGKEITVVVDGASYRTFTNAAGEFRIFGPKSAPAQVRVDGVQAAALQWGDTSVIAVP
jgi:hypothetical protein